jgi:GNAT superfamily N-acetyltransferase
MHPRLTDRDMRELPGAGAVNQRRRAAMAGLTTRPHAPGLLAFEDGEPVGWIAVAPRHELGRVDGSRATPRVDDADVWVIPCVTVRKGWRGRGVEIALI